MKKDYGVPGVYKITHVKSGKVYVGSTYSLWERLHNGHRVRLRKGTHKNQHLQNAWVKYGETAFAFEVIERHEEWVGMDRKEMNVLLVGREQFWINELKAAERGHGYNISPTAASPLGVKHTDETKAKLSAIVRKRLEDNPEYADKMKQGARERFKAMMADPEFAEAQAKRASDRMKKLHAEDDEFRAGSAERGRKAMADLQSDPEFRKAHLVRAAAQMKKLHEEPDFKAATAERGRESLTKLNADPKFRAAASERMRKLMEEVYSNPLKKAAHEAKKNAGILRRKMKKASELLVILY